MGDPGGSWGNAYKWGASLGYNHTPAVGSVAWWNGHNHVAYVEEVSADGSQVRVTADNYIPGGSGYTDSGWVQTSSVDGFLHPHDQAPAGTSHDPQGSYDGLDSPTAGVVHVRGWTFDSDVPTSPLGVHVYIGGSAGQAGAEGHDLGAANTSRGDVGAAYPGVGDNHGYDSTFTTNLVGNQPVYIYALNQGGGNNALLGVKNVTIADPSPVGNYEGIYSPSPGQVHVSGWALDQNAGTTPVRIDAYVGVPAGTAGAQGQPLGTANIDRGDVGASYPGTGNAHGFDQTFSTSLTGTQTVYLYAVNLDGTPGQSTYLGSKDVMIDPAPAKADPPSSSDLTSQPVATTPPPTTTTTTSPPTPVRHHHHHHHHKHHHH